MLDSWEEVFWEIRLESPPEIVAIDKNVHRDDPVDVYCLPELWSLHVYGYDAELLAGGHRFPIREGFVGLTPPGVETTFRYATRVSPHLYVHFRVPDGGRKLEVRAMQDAGERYSAIYEGLAEVIPAMATNPARANAKLWDTLWGLRELSGGGEAGAAEHPAVRKAVAMIERELDSGLTVGRLARETGVSYGYLGKLFEAEFSVPVVTYIRRRRMEKAFHLLVNSTLPVKTVANVVGLSDLQHFNKAVRGWFGKSPRAIRRDGL